MSYIAYNTDMSEHVYACVWSRAMCKCLYVLVNVHEYIIPSRFNLELEKTVSY